MHSVVDSFLKKDFILFFRERGREGEREGDKHCSFALTGNQTGDLSVYRLALTTPARAHLLIFVYD